MKFFSVALLIVSVSACGAHPTWEGMEVSAGNDCASQSANSSNYTACMERAEMESRQYEQSRQERDK